MKKLLLLLIIPFLSPGQNEFAISEQNCEIYIDKELEEANNLEPLTWLINNFSDYNFSEKCNEYINDIQELYWGGSITELDFNNKWKKIYDISRPIFGHPFQAGNCEWTETQLSLIEFLGKDNNDGYWFKIEILGGCYEMDENLSRLVYIIQKSNQFMIDDLISCE